MSNFEKVVAVISLFVIIVCVLILSKSCTQKTYKNEPYTKPIQTIETYKSMEPLFQTTVKVTKKPIETPKPTLKRKK